MPATKSDSVTFLSFFMLVLWICEVLLVGEPSGWEADQY
jgi:hypothetical protein